MSATMLVPRSKVTKDNKLIVSSECGVLKQPADSIVAKGRLSPGWRLQSLSLAILFVDLTDVTICCRQDALGRLRQAYLDSGIAPRM